MVTAGQQHIDALLARERCLRVYFPSICAQYAPDGSFHGGLTTLKLRAADPMPASFSPQAELAAAVLTTAPLGAFAQYADLFNDNGIRQPFPGASLLSGML